MPIRSDSKREQHLRRSGRAKKQRTLFNSKGFNKADQAESYAYDYSNESRLNAEDQTEILGREFWKNSRHLLREHRVLGLWEHKEGPWAFYPLIHGDLKKVKTSGQRGKHYAVGYHELGKMVEEFGNDITNWPKMSGTKGGPVPLALEVETEDETANTILITSSREEDEHSQFAELNTQDMSFEGDDDSVQGATLASTPQTSSFERNISVLIQSSQDIDGRSTTAKVPENFLEQSHNAAITTPEDTIPYPTANLLPQFTSAVSTGSGVSVASSCSSIFGGKSMIERIEGLESLFKINYRKRVPNVAKRVENIMTKSGETDKKANIIAQIESLESTWVLGWER